jgi:hypothetical protein
MVLPSETAFCMSVQRAHACCCGRSIPAASLKLLMLLQVQVEPLSTPNEGVSVVSLTRSSAKNAIGRQLLRELQEAINTLRQERTTRVVVLRSSCPGTFSAGADLKVSATPGGMHWCRVGAEVQPHSYRSLTGRTTFCSSVCILALPGPPPVPLLARCWMY